jgi:tetratricopeptide (TPR) repeat protein
MFERSIAALKNEIALYDYNIADDAKDSAAYYAKATALIKLAAKLVNESKDLHQQALVCYNEAIKIEPDNPLYMINRCKLYFTTGIGNLETAENDFNTVVNYANTDQGTVDSYIAFAINEMQKLKREKTTKVEQSDTTSHIMKMIDKKDQSKNEAKNDEKNEVNMDRKSRRIAELKNAIVRRDNFLKIKSDDANAYSLKSGEQYELSKLIDNENDKLSYIQQALSSLDMAIKSDPTRRKYLVEKMKIYADIGAHDKAREILETVKTMAEDYNQSTAMYERDMIKGVDEILNGKNGLRMR